MLEQGLIDGTVQQDVRGTRVRLPTDSREIEGEAQVLARFEDAGVHVGPGARSELGLEIGSAVDAFGRQVGVELKREEAHRRLGDLGVARAPEFERNSQSALADPAPGADCVNEDVDAQAHGCGAGVSRLQLGTTQRAA